MAKKPMIFNTYYCSRVEVDGKVRDCALFAFPDESLKQAARVAGWKIVDGNEVEGTVPGDFCKLNRFLQAILAPFLGRMQKSKKLRRKINIYQTAMANMRRKE